MHRNLLEQIAKLLVAQNKNFWNLILDELIELYSILLINFMGRMWKCPKNSRISQLMLEKLIRIRDNYIFSSFGNIAQRLIACDDLCNRVGG